jgi:hypothetical protein
VNDTQKQYISSIDSVFWISFECIGELNLNASILCREKNLTKFNHKWICSGSLWKLTRGRGSKNYGIIAPILIYPVPLTMVLCIKINRILSIRFIKEPDPNCHGTNIRLFELFSYRFESYVNFTEVCWDGWRKTYLPVTQTPFRNEVSLLMMMIFLL